MTEAATVRGAFAVGSTVYAASDGGLGISTDGGTTFVNRTSADGLGSRNVQSVVVTGSIVFASTWGGGVGVSTDGGASFTSLTPANSGLGDWLLRGSFLSGSKLYVATNSGLSISN